MAPKRHTVQLGKDGPQVTALGFGAMGLSAFYGAIGSDEERLEFLDHVYESGELNWDSADIYGDNEDLIGKWFKRSGKRADIFLATKFASTTDEQGRRIVRSDPEYCKQACAKSLKRLGIDQIDLYYCHRVDGKTPIEKTVQAMAELKQEGKIKYLGLSEVSSDTLRRAHKVHPICAVQIEYSPFCMDIEDPQIALLKTCRELGVATIAYSPLGRGMLTGRWKTADDIPEGDWRAGLPRFSKENFPKNLELVDDLNSLAKKKDCTVGQLTIAWLMAQGDDIIPIPGTTKQKNFDENMGSLDVKISPEENAKIRQAIAKTEVAGGRYPEPMMKFLFADTPVLPSQL